MESLNNLSWPYSGQKGLIKKLYEQGREKEILRMFRISFRQRKQSQLTERVISDEKNITWLHSNKMMATRYNQRTPAWAGTHIFIHKPLTRSSYEWYYLFCFPRSVSEATGYDMYRTLQELRQHFRWRMELDRISNSGGGAPRVVLFMPHVTSVIYDKDRDDLWSVYEDFRRNLPGKHCTIQLNFGLPRPIHSALSSPAILRIKTNPC